ncbi:hypothetical protein HAX54_049610, partial [Datura stramonium]|nr:hypothetical protein [Datura stramonium]
LGAGEYRGVGGRGVEELRNRMFNYDVPFYPLRVKGAQGRSKKKRKIDSNGEDSDDQGIMKVLWADLEAEKRKRRLQDKLLVQMWKEMKSLLRTLAPYLKLPKGLLLDNFFTFYVLDTSILIGFLESLKLELDYDLRLSAIVRALWKPLGHYRGLKA